MITQELINYVKTQVSNGILREKITSDLLDQEWAMEQINEAFRHVEQSIPTQISRQAMVSDMTQTPMTIKYFEWLMYASFVASIGAWIFQFSPIEFQGYMITAVAVPIIVILLKFFCVYKVAYHRAEWARIVLVVLLALNAFLIFRFFFHAFSNPIFLVTALPIILEITAIYFIFNASSNAWLATNTNTQGAGAYVANNTKWNKVIPRINKIFTIVSVYVFVVVVSIIGPSVFISDLKVFAFAMLGTVIAIGAINYYETFPLAKRYANSNSRLDTWFIISAVLRNLVLFLSVLPLIQVIGMVAMVLGGIPYLIIYYFMVRSRNKSVVAV